MTSSVIGKTCAEIREALGAKSNEDRIKQFCKAYKIEYTPPVDDTDAEFADILNAIAPVDKPADRPKSVVTDKGNGTYTKDVTLKNGKTVSFTFHHRVDAAKGQMADPDGMRFPTHGEKIDYDGCKAPGYQTDAQATHERRVLALNAAFGQYMPKGVKFSDLVHIFTIGKDVNKQTVHADSNIFQGQFKNIVNKPWTYIDLNHAADRKPRDRKASIGTLNEAQVRHILKLCGYGFSAYNKVWGTDANGNSVRRGRKPLGVAKDEMDKMRNVRWVK